MGNWCWRHHINHKGNGLSTEANNIMPNTYTWSRIEPLVKDVDGLKNAVTSLVVGMTATSEEGRTSYMDTMLTLTVDKDNFIAFEELEQAWAVALADKCAEDNDWKDSLDKQLIAAAARPTSKPFTWQVPAAPTDEVVEDDA